MTFNHLYDMKWKWFVMNKDLYPILLHTWSMMKSIFVFSKNVSIINNNTTKLIRNLVTTHNNKVSYSFVNKIKY